MNHIISLFVTLNAHFALALAQGPELTIQTQEGAVAGSLALPTVRQFLGVPYATAGRWQPPASVSVRNGTLNATQFGDSCPQRMDRLATTLLGLTGSSTAAVPESDDCLNLNIWSPSTPRKQSTAILLWIYGGAYQFGTTNFAYYNGANFVRDNEDLTVVTINYRTNIFGQPNAPQLVSSTQSQNFGLLDVEAAIKWVYDNIRAFGGDPERITIFGQSAGSSAVDAYSYSHPSDTMVKGIITMSGTLDLITSTPLIRIGVDNANTNAWMEGRRGGQGDTVDSNIDSEGRKRTKVQSRYVYYLSLHWNQIAQDVGCGTTSNNQQLACMRAVDSHTLEQAVIARDTSFYPIVDDISVFSDTRQRAQAGNFLQVPMLGGTTAQEADVLVVAEELATTGIVLPIVTQQAADILTSVFFTCPAKTAASDRSAAGVPTWRYQYQAVYPNFKRHPSLRAYHASDIPLVFGTYNVSTIAGGPTTNEIALSRFMQSTWVAFAKDPGNALGNAPFSWPRANNGGNNVVLLGNSGNPTGATFTTSSSIDSGCGIISTLVQVYSALGINVSLI